MFNCKYIFAHYSQEKRNKNNEMNAEGWAALEKLTDTTK